MGFSAKQLKALQRQPNRAHIRTRNANGRELCYLEGWYAISEANRIFGFDGWSRETTESRSVLARESRGMFLAVYLARVRITVKAGAATIVREGHGTGEGRGTSPAEVHDIALKAAETDGTKRALATFGKPFGLELYRGGRSTVRQKPLPVPQIAQDLPEPVPAEIRTGFHPDDSTPIPRPSRYYGRWQDLIGQHFRNERQQAEQARQNTAPPLAPSSELLPKPGDPDLLTLPKTKRLRDKAHLKFVASQPCLVCGRQPTDPHHLRFAQPRAIGMKVSDEFTVPLCRTHHRQLHLVGDEIAWWQRWKIEPLAIARSLWRKTHPRADEMMIESPRSDTDANATDATLGDDGSPAPVER